MRERPGAFLTVGAALTLSLGAAACTASGDPSAGAPLWNAQEMQVQVSYDTVLSASEAPLTVQFDTLRNVNGYPQLYATVSATDLSNRPLIGYTGKSCHWMFSAYDNPDRAGQPLWDEDMVCNLTAIRLELPPGGTQVFPPKLLDFAAITKTRGPGIYYFAARLWGSLGEDGPEGWLTERIPAGAVVLLP